MGAPRAPLGRLTKRPEFLAAARGRRFGTDRIGFQGLRRDTDTGLRVGYTVTKRVGNSPERSRIRRRLRAAMAEAGTPFAGEPVDVVLVGRRDVLSAPFPVLVADLARGLPAVIKPTSPRSTGKAKAQPAEPERRPDLQA